MNASFPCRRQKSVRGFTLVEVIVTMGVFILLAASVFGIITGVLQSASTLQENQNHRDQIAALNAYLKQKLQGLPAREVLLSYRRGDGEGLAQNGIILSDNGNGTAIDAKVQANGYYTLRIATYSAEVAQRTDVIKDDSNLTWTPLIQDVKTISWKFQDINTPQWLDQWSNPNIKPNLVELSILLAGDIQATTMDFWIPTIIPTSLTPGLQPNGQPAPHAP